MTIIERYMSSAIERKGDGAHIFSFQVKCVGIIWFVLSITFLCYWSSFFLGNHDFRFMRYGVPLDAGVWEGRFTQFLPLWLLTGGHILPAFNVLLGFAFFAAAAVMLAGWYGLPERYRTVLPFTLLIVLNPYVLTQLYYVHQILSIFVWHFLCVWGVILIDQAVLIAGERKKAAGYAAAGVLMLFASLGGYAASLELVLTICAGKFWLDILRAEKDMKVILQHYLKLGTVIGITILGYMAVISQMKQSGLIIQHMYNTHTLSLPEILNKFLQRWHRPWDVLYSIFPHESPLAGCSFLLLAMAALAASRWRRRFLWGALCLTVSVYLAFFLAFITPYDFFDTFRIHFFSVPYLMAVLCAAAFSCGGSGSRNMALAAAAALICVYAETDFYVQKIWLLGNRQDELYVERIKKDLLPRLEPQKKYRLATMGGLYGRKKFSGMNDSYLLHIYERDRELFRGPLYFNVMFSSGFFLYEAENPIWGDALHIIGGVFYMMTSENVAEDKQLYAKIFAESFGTDKEAQLQALRIMKPYPAANYCFIGEKDIFLMMPEVRSKKEELAGAIQRSLTKHAAGGGG